MLGGGSHPLVEIAVRLEAPIVDDREAHRRALGQAVGSARSSAAASFSAALVPPARCLSAASRSGRPAWVSTSSLSPGEDQALGPDQLEIFAGVLVRPVGVGHDDTKSPARPGIDLGRRDGGGAGAQPGLELRGVDPGVEYPLGRGGQAAAQRHSTGTVSHRPAPARPRARAAPPARPGAAPRGRAGAGSRHRPRLRPEREVVLAPAHLAPQQAGRLEHPQVRGDGGQRDVEVPREVGHPCAPAGEARQDRPAGPVGEGGQGAVESAWPGQTFNLTVN